MTSYFSSFTSSSAISSLGTRLNSLRRAIISGEEVDDPDNEDSSYVSKVLRAYYAEKGRPLPPWLPPDPKAPVHVPSRIATTTQAPPGGYAQANSTPSLLGRGGGLGDLWGDSGSPQPASPNVASLRRGRPGMPPGPVHSAPPGSTGGAVSQGSPQVAHLQPGTQPLPSQRETSYQPVQSVLPSQRPQQNRAPVERAASAQDRLRARLYSGRPSGGSTSEKTELPSRKPVGMGSKG